MTSERDHPRRESDMCTVEDDMRTVIAWSSTWHVPGELDDDRPWCWWCDEAFATGAPGWACQWDGASWETHERCMDEFRTAFRLALDTTELVAWIEVYRRTGRALAEATTAAEHDGRDVPHELYYSRDDTAVQVADHLDGVIDRLCHAAGVDPPTEPSTTTGPGADQP